MAQVNSTSSDKAIVPYSGAVFRPNKLKVRFFFFVNDANAGPFL